MMTTRPDLPIGTVRYDELLNVLLSFWLSGAADELTLRMVAQAYGLLDAFIARQRELSTPLLLAVEVPR